jgi:WS/DGAT/MGAT family acyltransferase
MVLTDRGEVPMNTGAILVFDEYRGPTPTEMWALLDTRLVTVPRLRQRVHRPPPGGGLPIWVDDADFAVENHVSKRELSTSAGLPELLDIAAGLVCERLPLERSPWRACLVTDPLTGQVRAVILVVHHVMADGLGGLAVLSALADPGLPSPSAAFPRPRPPYLSLALDAVRQRARGFAGLPRRLRSALAGINELGVRHGHAHLAGATSLTRRTSGRRRLSTVEVALPEVVAAAHSAGGTVNDVVLAAITGAAMRLLERRGESAESLVVSVPVSGRAAADPDHLGNRTGVRPVRIPLIADDQARLVAVVGITRAAGGAARASSSGPLGAVFRLLARLGLFAWFVDHQRLVDTFETNLRGPEERLNIGGHPVLAVIPMAVNPGNVGVSFDVLSYAGTLGITVVADPDVVPDLDLLTRFLSETLGRLLALQNPVLAKK